MEWKSIFKEKPKGFSEYQHYVVQTNGCHFIAYFYNDKFLQIDTLNPIIGVLKWMALTTEQ